MGTFIGLKVAKGQLILLGGKILMNQMEMEIVSSRTVIKRMIQNSLVGQIMGVTKNFGKRTYMHCVKYRTLETKD